MQTKIILILFILTVSLADIRLNFASFGDNSTYISNNGAKISIIDKSTEYSLNVNLFKTPNKESYRLSLGVDRDLSDRVSDFIFLNNESGYTRFGFGYGYYFSKNMLSYPYQHKVSVAAVNDSLKGNVVSFRYRFAGYYERMGINIVSFILGYTYDVDYRVIYNLSDMVSFIYKGYYNDIDKNNIGSVAIEVKL